MKAIILAAGRGTRFGDLTKDTHKSLLVAYQKPMLEEQIDLLNSLGVTEIAVVVGHQKDQIKKVLGDRVKYYENLDYATTNSVFSLWLAKDFLDDDVLILNGDLIVHPDIMRELIEHPSDMIKVVAVGKFNPTGHNVVVNGPLVVDTGSHYTKEETIGEYAGLNKVSKEKVSAVRVILDHFIAEGKVNEWYETALNDLLKTGHEMQYLNTKDRWWFEIDFPEELEMAKDFFKNLSKID